MEEQIGALGETFRSEIGEGMSKVLSCDSRPLQNIGASGPRTATYFKIADKWETSQLLIASDVVNPCIYRLPVVDALRFLHSCPQMVSDLEISVGQLEAQVRARS